MNKQIELTEKEKDFIILCMGLYLEQEHEDNTIEMILNIIDKIR